ncbi:MAG: MarR family transcriptional regulator [Kofleriaceae bacterium]
MDRPKLIYLINIAQRRVHATIAAGGDGHTAARAGLLLALSKDKPTPMAQVQQALDLGAPAASALVDRAIKAKLVERTPDPDDGRAWLLRLTNEGHAARKEAVRVAKQLNDRLCAGFSDSELAIVERWLGSVREKFPKETIE